MHQQLQAIATMLSLINPAILLRGRSPDSCWPSSVERKAPEK